MEPKIDNDKILVLDIRITDYEKIWSENDIILSYSYSVKTSKYGDIDEYDLFDVQTNARWVDSYELFKSFKKVLMDEMNTIIIDNEKETLEMFREEHVKHKK